jgi:hypothetical protein
MCIVVWLSAERKSKKSGFTDGGVMVVCEVVVIVMTTTGSILSTGVCTTAPLSVDRPNGCRLNA